MENEYKEGSGSFFKKPTFSRLSLIKRKILDELIIADRELVFQYEKQEKRAVDFIVAKTELIFQKEEKENPTLI